MIQIQPSEAMASQLAPPSSSSPSYSSETLADIAARVLNELRRDPLSDDDLLFDPWQSLDFPQPRRDSQVDDEFEFALVSADPNSSPVCADDIFCNGKIKPMYPIFDSNLLFSHSQIAQSNEAASVSSIPPPNQTAAQAPRLRRPPLRKLMSEESCSSSAGGIDGGAPESYCVWSPKSASAGRRSRKNTSSSSRRWRLRDLLVRSGSHGSGSRSGRKESTVIVSPEEAISGGEQTRKKKSLLPYRQELVGIFGNVNGIGRTLRPF